MVIDVVDGSELGWIGRKLPRNRKRREKITSEIESTQGLISTLQNAFEVGGSVCMFAHPIVVYGMSNAMSYVVDRIIDRAQGPGMISILRFHGHGASGIMSIAGSYGPDMSRHLSDIGDRRRKRTRRILSDLKPYFAPYGRVELHGCSVAQGGKGARLIRSLSRTLGVPVSAGIGYQYDESDDDAFRFEGAVRTAYPNGTIKRTRWRNLPGGYSGV